MINKINHIAQSQERNLLNSIYVLLLLSGSYLILMLPGVLRLPFFIFTVPLKYTIFFYSLFLALKGFLGKKATFTPPYVILPFIAFWFLYIIRILLDLYVFDVQHIVYDTKLDYIEAIVFCLAPCIGLCFAKGVDYEWVLKWSFVFFLIASCLSFFISLNLSTEEVQRDVGRFEGTQGMSSLQYGHNGVTLSLMAATLFFSQNKPFLLKILYVGAFCVGLFTIYLAGSRSPFVALVVCLFVLLFLSKGPFKGALIIVGIALPFVLFFLQLQEFLGQFGGVFFERLLLAIYEGQNAGRDTIFTTAVSQFIESPVWGSRFVISEGVSTGTYPHNLLLESLMATGIMGGTFFFIWFFRGLRISLKLIKSNTTYIWIALLFLQQVIFGMFSLSIYTHSHFWHTGIMLMCIFYTKHGANSHVVLSK